MMTTHHPGRIFYAKSSRHYTRRPRRHHAGGDREDLEQLNMWASVTIGNTEHDMVV